MFITLTAAEQKKVQAIRDSYTPELEKLSAAAKAVYDDKEKWVSQQVKFQAAMDSMQAELDGLLDQIQRKRFKKIAQGGTDAIIAHAKEQVPLLLEDVHRITKQQYKGMNAEGLKSMGIGTLKGGELLLNANYATQALKDELYLHIEALRDSKDTLRELLEAIIEAVEASNLTDNAEITDGQQPLDIKRFRRNPLGDLDSFGFMNDKVNAQLMQDGEIFQQKADGQLTLRWAINQAPQKQEEAVPTYIALTYDDAGIRTTKKLTAYDKQVYEAIGTRFWNWQQSHPQTPLYITPREIWLAMNGKASNDGKAKPSKTTEERIRKSIDKMRHIDCYMDISAEIEAGYLVIDDERQIGGYIKDYLLNCSEAGFYSEKGNLSNGYRVNYEPVLYTYNRAKKHLLYAPYEMLDTSDYISDSENVAEFKGYLLQQILLMKNAASEGKKGKRFKRNNIILLDTLYRDTGIQPPEERIAGDYANEATRQQIIRRNRKTDRQKIEALLDAWKAKGHIKGYVVLNQNNQPLKEKQQAKGYRIDL